MPTVRITEDIRSAALRRPPLPSSHRFRPSVTKDRDVPGLHLIVTSTRAFWALVYQARGRNPVTGKRWGGGTRYEFADAMLVGVSEAQGLALIAKGHVKQGRSPHHEAMALRASVEAARSIVPATVGETLDAYERALMARPRPTLWTKKQSVRNARQACALMKANALPVAAVDARMVRLLVETAPGSDAQRWHLHGALGRFLDWARKTGLVERNVCRDLDRADRPRPSKVREHVPTIETLRAVFGSVEHSGDLAHDLIRFLVLMPLRRNEVSGLRWSEVREDRICIGAHRMKARRQHELPLSPPAKAILERRKSCATHDLVFPTGAGKPYCDWSRLLARIRKAIGEDGKGRDDRFSPHDIRRAFVSHLAGYFDVDALDQCLAHVRGGILGTYQKSSRWPDRVRAINTWAELIQPSELVGEVVPFARRADG